MVLNVCGETVGGAAGGFGIGFVKYSDKTDSNLLEGIYSEQVGRECWPHWGVLINARIGGCFSLAVWFLSTADCNFLNKLKELCSPAHARM